MNDTTPDETAAFIAPDCGALSLLLRFGDVVVAGFFEPGQAEPTGQSVMTFEADTHADRVQAATTRFATAALEHVADGWVLVAA